MTAAALAWAAAGCAGTLALDAARVRRWLLAAVLGAACTAAGGAGAALESGWRVDAYRLGEIATVRLVPADPAPACGPKSTDRLPSAGGGSPIQGGGRP